MRFTWRIALFVLPGMCACQDRDSLRLEGEGVSLSYSCENPRASADSDAARELVWRNAILVVQHANDRGEAERVTAFSRIDPEEQFDSLELMVVRRLCEHPEEMHREPRFPEPGSRAPAFVLPVADGGTPPGGPDSIRVPDADGNYVLLDFWATWCGPCVRKYPKMIQLAQRVRGKSVRLVGVVHRDGDTRAIEWLKEHGGVHYSWLRDEGGHVARSYQVYGIPRMFLLDAEGRVVQSCTGCQSGEMTPENLEHLLSSLLPEPDGL